MSKALVIISRKLSGTGIFLANNLCKSALKKYSGQAGMTEVRQGSLSFNVALLMNCLITENEIVSPDGVKLKGTILSKK